jgi:hypothetical protein
VIAAIFGLACLAAAQWVTWRNIAVLYGDLFAAGSVYGFISQAMALRAWQRSQRSLSSCLSGTDSRPQCLAWQAAS